ncbi:MAG: lysostaphin resistance A-like protein [Candidatus Thorarchaeota archaeon]
MKNNSRDEWLRLFLYMLAIFFIVLMSPLIGILFTGDLFELIATLVFFLTFILMYGVTLIFVRKDGGESVAELGVEIDNRFVPHMSIGAIAGSLGAILVVAIAYFFGGQLRPFNDITTDLIVNEIIITAPIAFFEELVYRGYILSRMEHLTSRGTAIIFSSLFFSLLHFSWWAPAGFNVPLIALFTFNIFLGGVVLSLGYYWSGRKLWVPISFHFMWNFIAYILFPSFPREVVMQPEIFQIEWGLTTIIGFLFALSILWSLLSSEKKKI